MFGTVSDMWSFLVAWYQIHRHIPFKYQLTFFPSLRCPPPWKCQWPPIPQQYSPLVHFQPVLFECQATQRVGLGRYPWIWWAEPLDNSATFYHYAAAERYVCKWRRDEEQSCYYCRSSVPSSIRSKCNSSLQYLFSELILTPTLLPSFSLATTKASIAFSSFTRASWAN